jgi:2-methylisocitrate lyase-like PEP mutase family enzyme
MQTSYPPIRRIVTGDDQARVARVLIDAPATNAKSPQPGLVSTMIWCTDGAPAAMPIGEHPEQAGVTAIQIEDQEFPKKCGHTPDRGVIPVDDMVRKTRMASDNRSSADFLIIARTDARTGKGLDEAIRRGVAYADAGADIIFVESPESEAEMAEIGRRIGKPLLANMVNGGRTPMLPADRLKALGFSIAIFPAIGFLSAGEALRRAYADLKQNGTTTSAVPMYSFSDFNKLIGFEDVWEFERRYAELD